MVHLRAVRTDSGVWFAYVEGDFVAHADGASSHEAIGRLVRSFPGHFPALGADRSEDNEALGRRVFSDWRAFGIETLTFT